jgi:hypothetical protein
MKKFKLVALTLLTTLLFGMTSCLNDDSSDSQGYQIVEIMNSVGSTYFMAGTTKIIPSSKSLASVQSSNQFNASSGMAFIAYTYNPNDDSNKNYKTTNTLYVELTGAVSLNNSVVSTTRSAANDSVSTNPVVSLSSVSSTTSEDHFYIYDNRYLITGVNYYFSRPWHYFTLVYYPEETKSGDSTLNLYLRHRAYNDASPTYVSYEYAGYYPQFYYRTFDLASVFSQFAVKAGRNYPSQITLSVPVSTTDPVGLPANETTYSITYTPSSSN